MRLNFYKLHKNNRQESIFLIDIITAIKRIEDYTEGYDFEMFRNDQKTIDAVIRNFEVIGEASKNLSTDLKIKNPDVPWQEMYYLRNKVSHEYFGVDYEIIWDVKKII